MALKTAHKCSCIILFKVLFSFSVGYGQAVKLNFSNLNIGIDTRYTSNQDSIMYPRYQNKAFGISARYQTSVVANYVNKEKNKRFQIVDIVGGELTGGLFSSENDKKKQPFWFGFRFDLGLGMLYNINRNQQIGINWILMRFANDFLSDYVAGSELQVRYRYKRACLEAGTISRHVRVGGFSETYLKEKGEGNMTSMGLSYLIDVRRDLGLRIEAFNLKALGTNDKIVNIRLFYGRYF